MKLHLSHCHFSKGQGIPTTKPCSSYLKELVLLILFTFLYAGSQSQTISLIKKRVSSEKVITAIQEQSGYNLFYASGVLQQGKKADISFDKLNIKQALDAAVTNQPFVYELIGKTIVLRNRVINKSKGSSLNGGVENEDQMVNNGYTKTSKSQSTGSSSQVSREDIERNPAATMLDLIRNQSGVVVNGNSITIRGATSIMSSTDPLILVDGVTYPATNINSLDPNMVQNITILKDAGETAIYGSRGGNGVIVIATRQGGKSNQNNDLGSFTLNSDGSVQFTKAHITVVMKVISQWYKILVSYESKSPVGNYSGLLTSDIPYNEMIQIFQSAGITLKQDKGDIIITD